MHSWDWVGRHWTGVFSVYLFASCWAGMDNPSHSQQIVINKKDGRVGVWNEGDGLEKKTLLNRMESITVKTSISKNINHH
jgi:hypothetical protein